MSGTVDPVTLAAFVGSFIAACYVSANGKAIWKKGRMLFKTFSKWAQRKWLQKILAFRALKNSRDSKQASQPEREVLSSTPTMAKTLGEREGSSLFTV